MSGKAARISTSLSSEAIADNKLLLKSICKASDGFRVDLRSTMSLPGETYEQFSKQLLRSFEQWLEASEIDKTYASLKDFMVHDEFLSSLLQDLCTFVKELGLHTLGEAMELADDWPSPPNFYAKALHSSSTGKKSLKKEQISTDTASYAAKGPAPTVMG